MTNPLELVSGEATFIWPANRRSKPKHVTELRLGKGRRRRRSRRRKEETKKGVNPRKKRKMEVKK